MIKSIVVLIVCLIAFPVEAKFSVKRNSNMAFGDIASSVDGPGTAIISANADNKTVTGSIFDFGGSVTRARFTISGGTPSGFVTISLPSSLTISKSGVSLIVDNLVTNITGTPQLNGSGALTFYVSGRMNVPTNQAEKSGMTGSLTVFVEDITTTDTSDASATVSGTSLSPISISNTTAMSFGTLAARSTSGTMVVSTTGTTTATNILEFAGGFISQGIMTVTGKGGAAFSVTLPASATLTSGGNTMTVNAFNHDAGVSPSLSGNGSTDLNIGATLNVGASQPLGNYTGTYNVIVNYN